MYTQTIKEILENYLIDYHGYTREEAENTNYKNAIKLTNGDMFNFDYPIFNVSYKEILQTKILKHYYLRQICGETEEYFKLLLDDKLNIIMPYYNQLYNSANLIINPLINQRYTENADRILNAKSELSGTSHVTNNSQNKNENKLWDMPQSGDAVTDGYLTQVIQDKNDSMSDIIGDNGNTSKADSTDNFIRTITGINNISESELLIKYRETLLNIDNLIIKELADLFFILI